jgi:hypothetical protein
MTAVASLFERIGRAPPVEVTINKVRHGGDPRLLLTDVLTNGPVPATIVEERGAAHGLTKKQIRNAREEMNIIVFKETGKPHGRWFWILPQRAWNDGLTERGSSSG